MAKTINVVKKSGVIEEYSSEKLQESIRRANAKVSEALQITNLLIIVIEKEIAEDVISDYGGEIKSEDLFFLTELALGRHSFYAVATAYANKYYAKACLWRSHKTQSRASLLNKAEALVNGLTPNEGIVFGDGIYHAETERKPARLTSSVSSCFAGKNKPAEKEEEPMKKISRKEAFERFCETLTTAEQIVFIVATGISASYGSCVSVAELGCFYENYLEKRHMNDDNVVMARFRQIVEECETPGEVNCEAYGLRRFVHKWLAAEDLKKVLTGEPLGFRFGDDDHVHECEYGATDVGDKTRQERREALKAFGETLTDTEAVVFAALTGITAKEHASIRQLAECVDAYRNYLYAKHADSDAVEYVNAMSRDAADYAWMRGCVAYHFAVEGMWEFDKKGCDDLNKIFKNSPLGFEIDPETCRVVA